MKNTRIGTASGFTLIELLVVVLIIGILASIGIPQYFKAVEKGRAAEANNFIDSVRTAEMEYTARYGQVCMVTAGIGTPPPTVCPAGGSLGITIAPLKYFTCNVSQTTDLAGNPAPLISCTRGGAISPGQYGPYTIMWNPGMTPQMSCMTMPLCADLMASAQS